MVTLWFVVVTFASLPKDGCFTYSLRVHNIHGVCTLYSLLFACTTFNITAHQPPTLRVQAIPDCYTYRAAPLWLCAMSCSVREYSRGE